MGGGTADSTTLSDFLDRIEHRYGRANRIWVMDRGIPTEDSLAKMRSIGASYLVGTPKGRLTKLEQAFLNKLWRRCVTVCRSSGWPPRKTCTCWRKATRASTRSAAC